MNTHINVLIMGTSGMFIANHNPLGWARVFGVVGVVCAIGLSIYFDRYSETPSNTQLNTNGGGK